MFHIICVIRLNAIYIFIYKNVMDVVNFSPGPPYCFDFILSIVSDLFLQNKILLNGYRNQQGYAYFILIHQVNCAELFYNI
jgi:hypothetical protein